MAKKSIRDMESLYGFGENPNGMTAQTANGTAHATGTGWNRKRPFSAPEISEGGAWQKPRSNRTGE
jgi:hypothetical protein